MANTGDDVNSLYGIKGNLTLGRLVKRGMFAKEIVERFKDCGGVWDKFPIKIDFA